MEHYTKGEVSPLEEIEEPCFKLHEHAVHMTVNYGSKIRNLMGFALKKMQVRFFFFTFIKFLLNIFIKTNVL